jgi:hypothetical protein
MKKLNEKIKNSPIKAARSASLFYKESGCLRNQTIGSRLHAAAVTGFSWVVNGDISVNRNLSTSQFKSKTLCNLAGLQDYLR